MVEQGDVTVNDGGFIKIHRSIRKWEWHDDPITLSVWIHLLLDANYENKAWHGQTINRGQLVIGQAKYAKTCGITQQQLRTVLNRLKSTHEITTKSTNKYTVVTIANYDLYQSNQCESTHKLTRSATNEQQTNNIQITTTKEIKNLRNEEVIKKDISSNEDIQKKPKKERIVFVPPTVEEIAQYCRERNNSINPNQFFDWNESKGWLVGNSKMKDWKAAVRTWELRSAENQQQQSRYPKVRLD